MPIWSLPAALGGGAVALCVWNLSTGRRLSTAPAASRAFRLLSGFGAFLVLPAQLIGLLAPTAPGSRVLGPLAWLWPLVTVGLSVQAVWAAAIARASRLGATIIAAFNVLVAWMATARWMESVGLALPTWALAPGDSASRLAALAIGAAAFPWGAALLMPALAPALPARSGITRAARVVLVSALLSITGAIAAVLPGAHRALNTARALAAAAPDAGARGEFLVGIHVFGTLDGVPSGVTARRDMALADSLGVTALHIELDPRAATPAALDSMARSVEARRDSLTLIVTVTLGGHASPGVGDAERARLALMDRIVRRLRPDVLLPAEAVTRGAGAPSAAGWREYYERAARSARRVDRDITVALATAARTSEDSVLVDWVMAGGSPVDAVALTMRAGSAEPARFVDALNALARWASLARVRPDVWVVGVPSAPLVTGEIVQQQLVRYALAWGAGRAWVRGVIAGDASDVLTPTALCTALARPRRALTEVVAALRAQGENSPPAAPDSVARPDSTLGGTRANRTDTLTPPPQ